MFVFGLFAGFFWVWVIGCFQPFFGFVFGLGMFLPGVAGAILFSDVFFRDVFSRGLFSDVVGVGGIVYNILTIQSRLRTFFVGRFSSSNFFEDFSVVQVFGHLFFNQGLSFLFFQLSCGYQCVWFSPAINSLARGNGESTDSVFANII